MLRIEYFGNHKHYCFKKYAGYLRFFQSICDVTNDVIQITFGKNFITYSTNQNMKYDHFSKEWVYKYKNYFIKEGQKLHNLL